MAAKKKQTKTKEEKFIAQEEKQQKFLAKLGFVQLVFDFYRSPVA